MGTRFPLTAQEEEEEEEEEEEDSDGWMEEGENLVKGELVKMKD